MAKDVASRVSGDDALASADLERVERAAAHFASIHERWSGLKAEHSAELLPAETPGEFSEAATSTETPEEPTLREIRPAPELLELGQLAAAGQFPEPERGAVDVTPILGIETEDADAARPRFKTLMGVPRSSPDLDSLAGMEIDARPPHDTVRLERPVMPPPAPTPEPASPSSVPAPSTVRSSEEPSLAATSWPWERNAPLPRQSPRSLPPQWSALVESPLDVSAEVAALRSSARRRHWLAGMGTVAAAVAVFAVAAPRERTLALRWVREQYQTRVHASVEAALTASANALRPSAVESRAEPSGVEPTAAGSVAAANGTAANVTAGNGAGEPAAPTQIHAAPATAVAAAPAEAVLRGRAVEPTTVATLRSPPAPAAAPTALPPPDSSAPTRGALAAAGAGVVGTVTAATRAAAATPSELASTSARAPAAARSDSGSSNRADASQAALTQSVAVAQSGSREARGTTRAPGKPKQQIVAPRKHSQRSTLARSTVPPSTPASSATKPRGTHQNSPRNDSGGGIIRETPF